MELGKKSIYLGVPFRVKWFRCEVHYIVEWFKNKWHFIKSLVTSAIGAFALLKITTKYETAANYRELF